MIDSRQEKWLRDKLQWIFGFVQLEAEPFGEWPHWYHGTPPMATVSVYKRENDYRTVFMNDTVDGAPLDIEGWAFDRLIKQHDQTVDCPGRVLAPSGIVAEAHAVRVPKYPTGTYGVCPYCEKRQGERHGKIVLDNKWVEAVYSRPSEE